MKNFKAFFSGETIEFNFDLQACCKSQAIQQAEFLCPELHLDQIIQVDKEVHLG